MALNIVILFLLVSPSVVAAEDTVNKAGLSVTLEVLIIIGIVCSSVFIAISLISFVYYTFKFIKRKMSVPQYYAEDIPSSKDSGEFNSGNNDIYPQMPHLHQIQPIRSVSYMISSVRQSLTDLGHSLVPFSWSQAQHTDNLQSPANEKMDLPI